MFSPSSPTRIWLLLALVVASFSTVMKGQTISGTIRGTITDQQGGIIPAANVTATNQETGRPFHGAEDASGMYVISEVPPGVYTVRVQRGGYQAQDHYSVRVDVNRVTEEDFVLRLFTSTKPVEVVSIAPMTELYSPTQEATFNQIAIRELPILSRDINNLALLAPGAESVRTFSFASTLVPFATNGSGGRYNNFIVDSVSNNEPIFGGAATQFSNPDIFSDYAILTGNPKAEFGRDSGSTVNVITKSGSSKAHGTAFWFGQKNNFNAMTRADTAALVNTAPPYYEEKAGGTLGGPLGKKDTFFFLSYQYDRSRTDLSNVFPVIATVPTATGLTALRGITSPSPALASMLAYPSVESVPGLVGDCFGTALNPCFTNTVNTGIASPATVQLGSYLVPQGNLFDVYDHQASGRIDHRLNESNDFYARFLIDDLSTPQAVLAPASEVAYNDLGELPDSRTILHQRTQSAMLDERYAGGNSLNEMRFSFSRIAQAQGAFNLPSTLFNSRPSATVADAFGGFGSYANSFPSGGEQFTLGQDTSANVTHSNVFEVQENFSVTRNQHSVKMGIDFVRTQSNILNVPGDLGHYFFGSLGLAGGLKSFINEPAAGSTQALAVVQSFPDLQSSSSGAITGEGRNELPLRETDVAAFIQDDFRVRPNLTFSLGLRWERFGQPINGMLKLNPSPSLVLPTSGGDFGPRIGFAWSPGASRKTVIRSGYSLMYDTMPLNIPLLMWQSAPISPTIATLTPAGAASPSVGLTGAIPALPVPGAYPNSPLSIQNLNIGVKQCGANVSAAGIPLQLTVGSVPLINCSNQDTVDPNLSAPYVHNWSVGVQRELTPNTVLEVNYVGTKGTKLYMRQDVNPNQGWNTTCLLSILGYPCLNPRLNPNRGDITAVTNAGVSTYNALEASLSTRTLLVRGNTLTFTTSYTYSHMIDLASEIFGPSERIIPNDIIASALAANPNALATIEAITPFAQNPGNLQAERGNSSYDRRHRLVFSEIWGLPTRPDFTRAAKAFLGGWYLNGVGTVQSGQPFSPLNGIPTGSCADANGTGALTNTRPNIGNPSAPLNSVALLNDTTCRLTTPGYHDLNGNAITPSAAHFVQVPLGLVGGNAGRNILTGPGIYDFDFALFKQFHFRESKTLEFRWEVYNVFNHPNRGYLLGNVYATNAQPTPGFAFTTFASPAASTGALPENSLDALALVNSAGKHDFLSTGNMNTGNRTMQFGIHFTF